MPVKLCFALQTSDSDFLKSIALSNSTLLHGQCSIGFRQKSWLHTVNASSFSLSSILYCIVGLLADSVRLLAKRSSLEALVPHLSALCELCTLSGTQECKEAGSTRSSNQDNNSVLTHSAELIAWALEVLLLVCARDPNHSAFVLNKLFVAPLLSETAFNRFIRLPQAFSSQVLDNLYCYW